MKKTVIYFHSLSSPWAYMGWPKFRELIRKHDLDVVVRPTRIVPPNGGIPLRTPAATRGSATTRSSSTAGASA